MVITKSIKLSSFTVPLLVFTLLIIACKPTIPNYSEPIISLDNYQVEDGFELQAAASEPFIEAPVAMDFDNKGRMWVVEMKGYMRNLQGTGDEMPNGTISILEDLDHDGITDHAKIFMDSLILPRAIAHVYGGLLYAEPPNLYFVDIKDDKPMNKILVDSLYSEGGNVEHQPNGLMMHLDNWIYNARSNARYQRKNGIWFKEPASFRGQWGITKDNFGRLYYNNNSTQLVGDFVLPNSIIKNQHFIPKVGLNNSLTENQRVYPLHATSVNRGYQKGVLDKDSILINITSACGPVIYRGGLYSDAYTENAFICAPEANLIKRLKLTFETDKISAKQAIAGKEFIASTDEGFRPVNLFNGPDGNLYIVDMHRGIIQDKAFLTQYLHNSIAAKKLDTIIGMGRILRVINQNTPSKKFEGINHLNLPALIDLLKSSNGWLRDRAQQLLITNNEKGAIPLLEKLTIDKENSIAQIHALHTLNGLDELSFETIVKVFSSDSKSEVISHALVLAEGLVSVDRLVEMKENIGVLQKRNDAEIDLYLSSSLGEWIQLKPEELLPILYSLSSKYANNALYQEGIANSLRNVEVTFMLDNSAAKKNTPSPFLSENIKLILENKTNYIKNNIYTRTSVGTDARTAGYKIFRNLCATCHGFDGDGIKGLAPPLKNSKFVTGSKRRLAQIILHGLAGPITVNGKLYNLNTAMPGLADNPEFSDKDIRDIMIYMQNAFPGNEKVISTEEIKTLRSLKPENGGLFTEGELLQMEN